MKVTKTKKTKRNRVPKSVRRKLRLDANKRRSSKRDKMAALRMTLRISSKETQLEYIRNYIDIIAEDILRISNAIQPVLAFMDEITNNPELMPWAEKNSDQVNLFIDQIELIDRHVARLRRVRDESNTELETFVSTEYPTHSDMTHAAYVIIMNVAAVSEDSLVIDEQIISLVSTVAAVDPKEVRGK